MANELAKRLLQRVKQLREKLDLSQEAFAERAGLDYKHYQHVESGRKPNFTIETLAKMAKALGVEPWELLQPEAVAAEVGDRRQSRYGSRRQRSAKGK